MCIAGCKHRAGLGLGYSSVRIRVGLGCRYQGKHQRYPMHVCRGEEGIQERAEGMDGGDRGHAFSTPRNPNLSLIPNLFITLTICNLFINLTQRLAIPRLMAANIGVRVRRSVPTGRHKGVLCIRQHWNQG